MDYKKVEKMISQERLQPYLLRHGGDQAEAITHYKSNIKVAKCFYPILSVLEISLRNNVNNQLRMKYLRDDWFEDPNFQIIANQFIKDKIAEAKITLLKEGKIVSNGGVVSELTFGFWTALFDAKYEMHLWKNLRHTFPYMPKNQRQRKNISTPLNEIRQFRNRIFHHESIFWNKAALLNLYNSMTLILNWMEKDFSVWLNDIDEVIATINAESTRVGLTH